MIPPRLRSVLLFCACLVAGFAAAWFSKPVSAALSLNKPKHISEPARVQLVAIDQSGPLPINTAAPIGTPDALTRSSIETWAWMKRHQQNLWMTPFDREECFSPSLPIILGLSPAELEQLNAAIKGTKQRLDEFKLLATSTQISPDGKTVSLTIPSIPTESAPLYTNLINTLKQVLGPERYSLFADLTRDGFENEFDRFGLNSAICELNLLSVSNEFGPPTYSYKQSVTYASNGIVSKTSGTTTRADLVQKFPSLARYLPPDPSK